MALVTKERGREPHKASVYIKNKGYYEKVQVNALNSVAKGRGGGVTAFNERGEKG